MIIEFKISSDYLNDNQQFLHIKVKYNLTFLGVRFFI